MSTTLLYADILPFADRDVLAEEIAQIILDRVGRNTQLAADIATRTVDAVETFAGRARMAAMEARMREQQAAAQAQQDRGTERDPEVVAARERFHRKTVCPR
jgi:hypothetical protein